MPRNSAKIVPTPGLTARERLMLLRQALNMTRREFGEITGLTYHQIENIERDKQKIDADVYIELARHHPEYIPWLITDDWEWRPSDDDQQAMRDLLARIRHGIPPDGSKKT